MPDRKKFLQDFYAKYSPSTELTDERLKAIDAKYGNDDEALVKDVYAKYASDQELSSERLSAISTKYGLKKKEQASAPVSQAGSGGSQIGSSVKTSSPSQGVGGNVTPEQYKKNLETFLQNDFNDWNSKRLIPKVQQKYNESMAQLFPEQLQQAKFLELQKPYLSEFEKWESGRFNELQGSVKEGTDVAKLNQQFELERKERWDAIQNTTNKAFGDWYQAVTNSPEFQKQSQAKWDELVAQAEKDPEYQKELELKLNEMDETMNKFLQINEGRDFQKNKETNPALTLGKKLWSTARYQLPADLIGASIATNKAPYDITKAIDKLLPEGVSKFLTGGGVRPSEDPKFGLRNKENNDQIKNQLLSAYKLRNQGQEANKYLVDSLDKAQDGLDYLNWTFAAIGQAAGQIPAAIISKGATAYGQEIGTIYLDGVEKIAEERGITPEQVIEQGLDDSLYPILFGMAAGRLESIGAKGVGDEVMNSIGKTELIKSLRERTLGALLSVTKSGGKESLTEGAQTILEQLGVSRVSGKSWLETFSGIDYKDVKESMAQGAVGGSGLTMTGQALGSVYSGFKNKTKTAPEKPNIKPPVIKRNGRIITTQGQPIPSTPEQGQNQEQNAPVENVRPEPNKQESKISLQPSETTEQYNAQREAIIEKLNNGEPLTREEADFLTKPQEDETPQETQTSEVSTEPIPPTAVDETAKEGGDMTEYNVLSMLNDSKALTKQEKQILYRQFKAGVMSESEVSNYTGIKLEDINSGNVNKWAQVILDKLKSKEISAEDVSFDEIANGPSLPIPPQQQPNNPPAAQPNTTQTNTEVPGSEGVNREVGEVEFKIISSNEEKKTTGKSIKIKGFENADLALVIDPVSDDQNKKYIVIDKATGKSFGQPSVTSEKQAISSFLNRMELLGKNESDIISASKSQSPAQSPKSAEVLPATETQSLPDLDRATNDELLETSDPVKTKQKQKQILTEYAKLKKVIECLTK